MGSVSITGRQPSYDVEAAYKKEMSNLVIGMGAEQYAVTITGHADAGNKQTLTLTLTQLADKPLPPPPANAPPAPKAAAATASLSSSKPVAGAAGAAAAKPKPKPPARLTAPLQVQVSSEYQKGDQVFEATVNGARHLVQVVEAGDGSSVYTLQFRGTTFEVDIRHAEEHALLAHMKPKPQIDTSKFVVSPMPGAVYSVSVKPGDKVLVGQEVCVVEAMKMQNALRAQREGTVKVTSCPPCPCPCLHFPSFLRFLPPVG